MDTFLTAVVIVEGLAIAALSLVVAHLVVLVRDGEGTSRSVLLGISSRVGARHVVPDELSDAARIAGVTSLVFLKENCESCLAASRTLPDSPLAGRVLVVVDGHLPAEDRRGLDDSETAVVEARALAFETLGIMLTPLLVTFDHSNRIVASEPLSANLTLPALTQRSLP